MCFFKRHPVPPSVPMHHLAVNLDTSGLLSSTPARILHLIYLPDSFKVAV